jgi:hypothetical protein
MGEIEAKVQLKPDAAAQSFLAYAGEQPDKVDPSDYHKIGMKLTERNSLNDAVAVLGAGITRFPGDPKIDEALKKTEAVAQQSGDPEVLKALAGLGYAGSTK